MPLSGRARFALFGLVGMFLIPIYFSSLNGLTHVITCRQRSSAPFTIELPAHGQPTVSSATTVTRGANTALCGGLSLDMGVTTLSGSRIRVLLPITNTTHYTWHGSVTLVLGHTTVPVSIGAIHPGTTRASHVDVHISSGTDEIGGSVLFGP